MDNLLEKLASKTATIGMIGMGYVGLPLAVEFGRKYPVVGFDIKPERVAELTRGEDSTLEVDPAELRAVPLLAFTGAIEELEALQRLYRHRPHADRPLQASREHAASPRGPWLPWGFHPGRGIGNMQWMQVTG